MLCCYLGFSGAALPHVIIAAAHHVVESGFILVARFGIVAFGTGVSTVAMMGLAILGDSWSVVVVVASSSSSTVSGIVIISISTASLSAIVFVVVVDLGLDVGHGREKSFHCCGSGWNCQYLGCIGKFLFLGFLGC